MPVTTKLSKLQPSEKLRNGKELEVDLLAKANEPVEPLAEQKCQ
jgi:hypothetical protein